jgi:hypothetical protein
MRRFRVSESTQPGQAHGVVGVRVVDDHGPRRGQCHHCQCGVAGPIQPDFSGAMVRDRREVNKMGSATAALGRSRVPDNVGPMIAALPL